jgi:tRNA 2-thiouridine synthesizing protein E
MSPTAKDKEGYLKNLNDWSEVAAKEIAAAESIDLTDAHWEVITLLRDVYQEFQHSPITRVFVKLMGDRLGKDKGRSIYLMKLFPETPMRKACKIAGLPKPTNCM